MALTDTQQRRFDELSRKRQVAPQGTQALTPPTQQQGAVQPQTGLTATKQARFDALSAKRQGQQGQAQQQPDPRQQRIDTLLGQLGGQLPLEKPETQIPIGGPRPLFQTGEQTRQQKAFQELQGLGFTPDEIGSALAFREATKSPFLRPRDIGAVVGSLAALSLNLIPGLAATPEEAITIPAGIKIGAEIFGAAFGGATAEALNAAADPDLEFTFGEYARVFGEEGALEALSIGGVGTARKLVGGARKTLTPGVARLSAQLSGAGKRAGVKGRRLVTQGFKRAQMRFLPATFSQNQLIDTLQGIGEGSLIGSNTIFQFKRGIRKSIVQLQKELIEDFTKGTTKRGTLASATVLFDTLQGNRRAWSKTGGMLYRTLDDKGVKVSTKPLTKFSKAEWNLIQETGEIASIPNLNTVVKKAANKIDTPIEFESAHRLRSTLLTIERNAKKGLTPKPQTARVARRMINEITGSMESAAKTKPGLFKQYRRANNYWRAGSKRFDNDIVRPLVRNLKNHPQLAALAVFHPDTAQEIRLVRKAAGEKGFKEMRGAWLEQLTKDSASKEVGEEGVLLGTGFLDKFNNMGDDTLAVIFTPQEIRGIKDVAETAAFTQQKTGGVGGSLKIVQGIALFSLVASPLLPEGNFRGITRGTAGVILLGPAVISRMITNPVSARLLSEGFKIPTGTRQGVAIATRLIKTVLRTRADLQKEQQVRTNRIEIERAQRERKELFLEQRGPGVAARRRALKRRAQ